MSAEPLFPIPAATSHNWIEVEAGRQLRARIRQRIDWCRAAEGEPPSVARLAAEFDRSPSTISHHIRRASMGRTLPEPAAGGRGGKYSPPHEKTGMPS